MKIEIEMVLSEDGQHYQFIYDKKQLPTLGIALTCCEDFRDITLNAAVMLYTLDADREKFMEQFYKHAQVAEKRLIEGKEKFEEAKKTPENKNIKS